MQTWMKALCAALVTTTVLAGCGPAEETDGEDVGELEEELNTRTASFVTLRRDYRRCIAPLCGGYWAKDVKTNRETYVSGLDLAPANLDDDAEADLLEGIGEAVVKAKLGKAEPRYNTRPLVVYEAWRGMPGKTVARGAKFYFAAPRNPQIRCVTAPCPNLAANEVNSSKKQPFDRFDLDDAAPAGMTRNWLEDRILNADALVAGKLVAGARFPGGREKVLDASQVFVKLPEAAPACPVFKLTACPEGQVWSYERDAARCVMPAGCVEQRACVKIMPICPEGYTQTLWTGADSCLAHACDPTWSVAEAQ